MRLSRDNNRRVSGLESSTNNERLNIIEEKSISEQKSASCRRPIFLFR